MRTDMFPWRNCVVALVLLVLPVVVQAQLTFTTNDDSITIIGYTGSGGVVVIPNTTNGYSVTGIGDYAFAYSTGLTSVTIPSSVTNIGVASFLGCSSLTNISVNGGNSFSSGNGVLFDKGQDTIIAYPEGLANSTYTFPGSVNVGDYAFAYCDNLTRIYVTTTSVGEFAFYGCTGLISATVTNELEGPLDHAGIGIGAEAFAYCTSLDDVSISSTVTNIGGLAFAFCTNMTSALFWGNAPPDVGNVFYGDPGAIVLYLPGTTGWGPTFGGALAVEMPGFEFEYTTNDGSISITITGYVGPGGAVGIPETINGYAVTSIGPQAFQGNNGVTSITISNDVTSVGAEAFANCTNLTSVFFPSNAPPDVGNAFYADPEAVVYYPPGTTGWGATFGGAPTAESTPSSEFYYEIYNGSITITGYHGSSGTVAIPSTINGYPVTTIQVLGAVVTNVIIPSSVTNMQGALQNSFVISVTFADGTRSIPGGALDQCGGVITVTIPDSVTSVGDEAFDGCFSLTNIVIPNGVTNIGNSAFEECYSLTSFAIPDSVTSIGEAAFSYCIGLTNIVVPYSITGIAGGTFENCVKLTSITIPSSVMSIGPYAFNFCTSLSSVTIPNSVTSIGAQAFDDCRSLTNIVIPNSATNIGIQAFQGCSDLTNVTIPNGVTSIGMSAFNDCTSLTSMVIPASVTSIGQAVFAFCTGLTNISVDAANPAYVSTDGILFDKTYDTLVQYPAGLTSSAYIIPNSVTSIYGHAFEGCTNLTSVIIPGGVTNMGSSAFQFCSSLKFAYFQGNAPPVLGDTLTFNGDPATVYYLPGTTGWGTSFGSVPTALWVPQATAFSAAGNQFSFDITWASGRSVVVEACTNLANPVWLPVFTNTLSASGMASFSDPQATNYPNRFYRFTAP